VIAERGLDRGSLEYRHRRAETDEDLPVDGAATAILERLFGR